MPECCCPQGGRCDRYRVDFLTLKTTDIDDGFLGGSLEVKFLFTVNGQTQTWDNNALRPGVLNLGLTFFVDVPTNNTKISISVLGFEFDPIVDDSLPWISTEWAQAQNWGVGAHTVGPLSNAEITYSIDYQISCAEETTSVVSADVLLAYARAKAEQRNAQRVTADSLLSWSLRRLRRAGWRVTQATGGRYILTGSGPLPGLLQRKFGTSGS